MKALLGTKIGMTRIFDEKGNAIPVTAISTGPCFVVQKKTKEKDGYSAIQLGFKELKEKHTTKPLMGHFKKANIPSLRYLREFRTEEPNDFQLGQKITCEVFSKGDYIDVSGLSKGHGFTGGVKRHGFRGGPRTHGQSDKLRAPGALSGSSQPSRVFKGTRMAGRMGYDSVTIHKLEIVKVEPEKNLILIKGAVPGVNGGCVVIKKTIKKIKEKKEIKIEKKVKGMPGAKEKKVHPVKSKSQ